MGRNEVAHTSADAGQKAVADEDGTPAEPDLTGVGRNRPGSVPLAAVYQVTSPAPVRTFATRASMKRRSESRLR